MSNASGGAKGNNPTVPAVSLNSWMKICKQATPHQPKQHQQSGVGTIRFASATPRIKQLGLSYNKWPTGRAQMRLDGQPLTRRLKSGDRPLSYR